MTPTVWAAFWGSLTLAAVVLISVLCVRAWLVEIRRDSTGQPGAYYRPSDDYDHHREPGMGELTSRENR